jgi:hypothetical protein
MKKYVPLGCMFMIGLFNSASAEELELFNALVMPAESWNWADAKIQKKENGLLVTEINKAGDYGSVFVDERFPFHPAAKIKLRVDEVLSGDYTMQVLSFVGNTHIQTLDSVKSSRQTGVQEFEMSGLKLPPESQAVLFKLWVGGAEGASTKLGNLTYSLPVAPDAIVKDDAFASSNEWEAVDVVLNYLPQRGVEVKLAEGKSYGSILYRPLLTRSDDAYLFVHVPGATSGSVTMQVVVLDSAGAYIQSIDVLPAFGAGWRSVRLGQIEWPEGATHFRVKLWVGGTAATEVSFNRLLLLSR